MTVGGPGSTPVPPPPAPAPADSISWPLGGEREVESRLGSLDRNKYPNPTFEPQGWKRFGKGALIGGSVGMIGLGAAGAIGAKMLSKPNYPVSMLKSTLGWGAAGLIAGGAIMGFIELGKGKNRKGDIPDLARADTQYSMTFDNGDRTPLPPASKVPTIEAEGKIGEYKAGISGSSIGSVVTFEREVLEMLSTRIRSTSNTNGEPLFSFGNVSGTEITYDMAVNERQTRHNTMGIGKVLYNQDGYDTMAAALDAFDGKHSVAIISDSDRYYLADFDAEDFKAIGEANAGMVITDDRIKAIFTNKSVYYPTDLNLGPASQDDAAPAAGKVFLFAHGQDIESSLPASVEALNKQPVGTYETNAEGTRERGADMFTLNIGSFHMGDEWSGPGWTDKREAIDFMLSREGNQALVHRGDRYFVADTYRRSAQGKEISGDLGGLNTIINASTRGAFIHGLSVMDAANGVELVEEIGGLYTPVGDWWVRANLE